MFLLLVCHPLGSAAEGASNARCGDCEFGAAGGTGCHTSKLALGRLPLLVFLDLFPHFLQAAGSNLKFEVSSLNRFQTGRQ